MTKVIGDKMPGQILESEKRLATGVLTEIYPGVKRLLAPNAGPFTGPGTNTYFLGKEEIAVIDPGPANQKHIDEIVESLGSRIRRILCTHTHFDHSPGAALLIDSLAQSVEVLGLPTPEGMGQDQSFSPSRTVKHGDLLQTKEFTLETIHTPGHASNHLCFLYHEAGILFTGDQIMQGSSVIISPPDGDMIAYLDSLKALKDHPLKYLAPAHGHLMESPFDVLDFTIQHRLDREAKVQSALERFQKASLDELVPAVYDDVPVFMHPAARQSLWAHLIKFQEEGKAILENDIWEIVQDAS